MIEKSELLTDDSGKQSMGRLLCLLLVLGYLVAAGLIAWKTGTLTDVPAGLAALVTLLYRINKLSPTHAFTPQTKGGTE